MAYTKYSLTPANNNAAPPDGAPEGMLPSAVNDTMRDMMAQIRDVGDGIRGGTYTMTAPVITGGSITGVALSGNTLTNPVITGGSINNTPIGASTANTGAFTSLTNSGNLTFAGTGNRILGDFSNATVSSRVFIQTSTTNSNTTVGFIPNGTAVITNLVAYNNSDPTNASTALVQANSTDARFAAGISGTGTYLPLTIFTSGVERLRIDTSGNVGIGTSSYSDRLAISVSPPAGGSRGVTLTDGTRSLLTQITGSTYSYNGVGASENLIYAAGNPLSFLADGQPIKFCAGSAERVRIDSSGNLLVGTTSGIWGERIVGYQAGDAVVQGLYSLSSSYTSSVLRLQTETGAGTTWQLINGRRNGGADVFVVYGNGSVVNSTGSYGTISDAKLKENIVDATSKLDDVMQLKVRNFNFKDEPSQKQIGFVAQEIENVFPSLVEEIEDKDEKDVLLGTSTKQVKTTVLIPILVKAIQEQQTLINNLTTRLNALEGK